MQQVFCPSCGAALTFKASSSVMAVCEYCRTTLLKDAGEIRDIGKMSSVLEDYTPLQLHSSGRFQGHAFTLIGRIQLRYDAGLWNEWYLLFDDGSPGWLADASGQYMLTRPCETPQNLPAFEALRAGMIVQLLDRSFVASDVRSAACTGGQGELPFAVGAGFEARLADCRHEGDFVTLDYSDGAAPVCYTGQAVTLEALECQLLRSHEEIAGTADRYRGKTMPLSCPGCGSPIAYRAGVATFVVCPSCHTQVDCTEAQVQVLEKHAELERVRASTSLQPGDELPIKGAQYSVLGFTQCREDDAEESSSWIEYLLFNQERGLVWLVETDSFELVEVLDAWPQLQRGDSPLLDGQRYSRLYDYSSEVVYTAGTFNWRVQVGDRTQITDFGASGHKLTRESSEHEVVWSKAVRVPNLVVDGWLKGKPRRSPTGSPASLQGLGAVGEGPARALSWLNATFRFDASDRAFCRKAGWALTALLCLFNVPLFDHAVGGGLVTLIGGFVLWAPLLFTRKRTAKE